MEDTASAENYKTLIREYETRIREYETEIKEYEAQIRVLQPKDLDRISKGYHRRTSHDHTWFKKNQKRF